MIRSAPKFQPARLSSGFTLLEVLIAVVVLSIGLLGLAALQFSGLRGVNQSYERSQAHALAYEISDAMRANRVAATGNAFATAPDNPPADQAAANCHDIEVTCTNAQAAEFALVNWHNRLRTLLPSSSARISCSVNPCTPGALHFINVMWDENRTGIARLNQVATSCPTPAAFDEDIHFACIQVSLTP